MTARRRRSRSVSSVSLVFVTVRRVARAFRRRVPPLAGRSQAGITSIPHSTARDVRARVQRRRRRGRKSAEVSCTRRRWDDAIGAFGEAIAVAPKDDECRRVPLNRAAAYLQRGDAASAKRAKVDASVCVKARPHWARGWSRMATACRSVDDAGASLRQKTDIAVAGERGREKVARGVAKRMGDRPKRSSSGWRMPSMPSMPSMPRR